MEKFCQRSSTSAPIVQKHVCNVYTYSNWASILHATVGGWVVLPSTLDWCACFDSGNFFRETWQSSLQQTICWVNLSNLFFFFLISDLHKPTGWLYPGNRSSWISANEEREGEGKRKKKTFKKIPLCVFSKIKIFGSKSNQIFSNWAKKKTNKWWSVLISWHLIPPIFFFFFFLDSIFCPRAVHRQDLEMLQISGASPLLPKPPHS